MADFAKLTVRGTKHATDVHGRHILEVSDPHALIQAAGYLKHCCALDGENVYFRGQETTYASLAPSLFRGISNSQGAQAARSSAKNQFLKQVIGNSPIFNKFSRVAHEPLLQHYGLQTTWLDLVDNIWVALWFASHRAHSSGNGGQYLHFERRNPLDDPTGLAYILLVGTEVSPTGVPGFNKGRNTETIDLRICAPSIFLRPHAQHGILFRMRGQGTVRPVDYSPCIRGVISISLRDAISWLGDAPTLSAHGLFPPPFYDQGYKILLDGAFNSNPKIGSIAMVGA
ncbi:FRG domain-containing protein [uncultured Gammaproteobacteria bacterium]